MKPPVVEGMGLAWQSQGTKLRANPERFNCNDIVTVGADGRQREKTCIPLKRYPAWLNTINPAKIPDPAVRQRGVLYQDGSAEALYQFWATGVATVESVAAAIRETAPEPAAGNVVQMSARRSFADTIVTYEGLIHWLVAPHPRHGRYC